MADDPTRPRNTDASTAAPRLWPLVLRLLGPVALLAGLAGVALVRDLRTATADAMARSGELTEAVASRLEAFLFVQGSDAGGPAGPGDLRGPRRMVDRFRVGPSNLLVDPPEVMWPPRPEMLPVPELPDAGRCWKEYTEALAAGDPRRCVDAFDAFLRFDQPELARHRGVGRWELAMAWERLAEPGSSRVTDWSEVLASGRPQEWLVPTESGVPVGHLALLRMLENLEPGVRAWAPPGAWVRDPQAVARGLAASGSPMARPILDRLDVLLGPPDASEGESRRVLAVIREAFLRAERIRDRHARALRARPAGSAWPGVFWVDPVVSPGWLAVEVPEGGLPSVSPEASGAGSRLAGSERSFDLWLETWVRAELQGVARGLDPRGNHVLHLVVDGRAMAVTAADSTHPDERPRGALAGAGSGWLTGGRRTLRNGAEVTLGAGLADPSAYYAGQRRRALVFGVLLAGAVLVAGVAVRATHRSLVRQHELGLQKSNFVSSVSHELRAPLASIRLLAEGLERGAVTDEHRRREYHHLIVRETQRLGALVENVLDFSRIEQGRKRFELEPTDLRALVAGTLQLVEPLAIERGVRISLECGNGSPPGGEWELNADGRAIQQALLNLLDNGLKHSPQGSVLGVSLARMPSAVSRDAGHGVGEGRGVFRLAVTDTGPGIPECDQGRIFEPFHRLGSELRRETTGVGIGLGIVKHVVEAHGGRVEVLSRPGAGATFTLVLPCDS